MRATLMWLLLVAMAPLSWGQEPPVRLLRVEFARAFPEGGGDAWLEVALHLEGGPALSAAASNPRFNDRVQVGFLGVWRVGGGEERRWFEAEATLLTLEQGRTVIVHFLLPPEVLRRDSLGDVPEAWQVTLAVEGILLPERPEHLSSNLRDEPLRQSFAAAAAQAVRAPGLQPIYLTPFFSGESERLVRAPAYLRERNH